jgi:hypothetical protein
VIFYGDPDYFSQMDLASSPGNVVLVYGEDGGDNLGTSVASGDLDGDGFDEVILGAQYGDGPNGFRQGAGEVVVVYGQPAQLPEIDLAAGPAGISRVYGPFPETHLGFSSTTGDLNGDGFDELIAGAAYGDGPNGTRNNCGAVDVIYGGPDRIGELDLVSNPDGAITVIGGDAYDSLGHAVQATDLDGDGFQELVVGAGNADGADDSIPDAGELVVIRGRPDLLPHIDLVSPPSDVTMIFGSEPNDSVGRRVGAGDFDGDGLEDLAVPVVGLGLVSVLPGAPRTRYRHDTDTYAFIDATVGASAGLACDDCSAEIPIGFDFVFYGRTFDQVTVSSNGYLTFGGPGDVPGGHCPPASNPPNDLIAVFWDDLNPEAGGAVYYLLEGTEPNRRLTVEWHQVPLYPATDAATFEVTLFESSNQILMQYQDVTFGNGSDRGGTAVIGVENHTGYVGTAEGCYRAHVTVPQADRYRPFAAPTTVWSHAAELGNDPEEASGLWHRSVAGTCEPSARSNDTSWYYGQEGTCTYETGAANSGELSWADVVVPQDAELSFWTRRGTEDGQAVDESWFWVSTGTQSETIRYITEETDVWRHSDDFLEFNTEYDQFAPIEIGENAGQAMSLVFSFDTVDATSNEHLGWMLDEIELKGCPVWGGGGYSVAAEALATAQPGTICETQAARLDALGSYCTACDSLDYQWYEGGAPLPGAVGVTLDVPAGSAPGLYDYTVEIGCSANPSCADSSDNVELSIVALPEEVGPTLTVGRSDTTGDLEFHWTDVASANDYVLFSDAAASGGFETERGSSASGVEGVILAVPTEDLVFYLVAGRNPVCGLGIK